MSKKNQYYKIQNGGKFPMQVNNIIIFFTMEIKHK